jgi:hypothetical protein
MRDDDGADPIGVCLRPDRIWMNGKGKERE